MMFRPVAIGAFLVTVSMLSGCGFFPAKDNPEFTLTGPEANSGVSEAPAAPDAELPTARLARAYCADGYDTLATDTVPTETAQAPRVRLQCKPHQSWPFGGLL